MSKKEAQPNKKQKGPTEEQLLHEKRIQREQQQKEKQQNHRELTGMALLFGTLYLLLCLYDNDAVLVKPGINMISGMLGQIGRYLLPFATIWTSFVLIRSEGRKVKMRISCMYSLIATLAAVVHLLCETFGDFSSEISITELYETGKHWGYGGLIPGMVAELLQGGFTTMGALVILLIIGICLLLGVHDITVNGLISAMHLGRRAPVILDDEEEVDPAEALVQRVMKKKKQISQRTRFAAVIDLPVDDPPFASDKDEEMERLKKEPPVDVEKKQVTIDQIELQDPDVPVAPVTPLRSDPEQRKHDKMDDPAEAISREIAGKSEPAVSYVYPSLDLLHQGSGNSVDATGEMRDNTRRLADALRSFGVEPHVVDVVRGPSVTRYELALDPGVKLSKITNLADDIALALGAQGVRIAAIPDKISVVGIEVPNKAVNTVFAREVIGSQAFRNNKSRVSFAVGKDISGNCIVGDIAKLPHLLIAGTTGSGKSVCMNTLIVSLLYKSKPEDVRLIMVDPKMVELGVYNGIPHLLIPVVTDPKKAAGALQWTVTEMMRRYRLMSDAGVRDLESYNKTVENDPDEEKMPKIVVVIDELADLMLVAAKEVEESICRIAQMGRASGIHLIIATQRPSSDVITGLMKANIPSRIAFAVASAMESRIILDGGGAEKLVGKGDMLFAPLGLGRPKRVQGCFISDEEVQAVTSAIKAQTTCDYSDEIMARIEKGPVSGTKSTPADPVGEPVANDGDELLPAAVEAVLEVGHASVSMLQRRLKLGYARAARIVDEMEEKGIVGPFDGAKPRALLITKEQWATMQGNSFEPPVEDEIL